MALGGEAGKDAVLLVMRAVLGGLMAFVHGWPKLAGGEARWTKLGKSMEHFGIDFAPEAWGLAAALAETVGGALLLVGLFTRPAAAALLFTMFVAGFDHFVEGGLKEAAHPIETGMAVLALLVLGPGRHSVDARVRGKS